jgi:hypothetical protein
MYFQYFRRADGDGDGKDADRALPDVFNAFSLSYWLMEPL